jgi:hypothetical protein
MSPHFPHIIVVDKEGNGAVYSKLILYNEDEGPAI